MTAYAELRRRAEQASSISGKCRHARTEAHRGNLKSAAGFHAACPGKAHSRPGQTAVVCLCPCHRDTQTDLAREIEQARHTRQIIAGINLDATPPKVPRTKCRNNHEMTPENTGPKGDCRTCKRVSSAKSKKRKKELGA